MPHVTVKMDKEFKKEFAKYCEKRGVSMSTAFRKMAKMAVRKDKDVDENGFDAATRAEPERRLAEAKVGIGLEKYGLNEM